MRFHFTALFWSLFYAPFHSPFVLYLVHTLAALRTSHPSNAMDCHYHDGPMLNVTATVSYRFVVSYFLIGIYFVRAEARSWKCGMYFFGLKRHHQYIMHAGVHLHECSMYTKYICKTYMYIQHPFGPKTIAVFVCVVLLFFCHQLWCWSDFHQNGRPAHVNQSHQQDWNKLNRSKNTNQQLE